MEYPKVMYSGVWSPEAGLGALKTTTVNSADEEKDALENGFVCGPDVESLGAAAPKPKGNGNKKKSSEE